MIIRPDRWKVVGTIVLLTLVVVCGSTPRVTAATGDEQTAVRVVVSILPQVWFAERIGGERVQVSVLVGPGQSPATYDASARQMALLQEADLFVFAGVPFERGLLPRISRLPSKPAITGIPVPTHSGEREMAGHDHNGLDPHYWLDPHQAQVLADTMCAALCRLRPESETFFRSRLADLRMGLVELDGEVRKILSPHRGREFYVFHPAFGHFAKAYDLTQIAIEAGGHEPGARHLAEVIEHARQAGGSAIIVQPQFSQKSAGAVARSLGWKTIALDPLAPHYDSNLRKIAVTLAELFARQPSLSIEAPQNPGLERSP